MADGWTTLGELRQGAVFETRDGILAHKTEYHTFNRGSQCDCYLLASGEAAHFSQLDAEPVREVDVAGLREQLASARAKEWVEYQRGPHAPAPDAERLAVSELRQLLRDVRGSALRPARRGPWVKEAADRVCEQLDAVIDFLGLHSQERAFIHHLAENRLDGDTAQVYADWLEENGRAEAGELVRLLRAQRGDLLVVTPGIAEVGKRDFLRRWAEELAEQWANERGVLIVMLGGPDQQLSLLDREAMRREGWVRVDEATGGFHLFASADYYPAPGLYDYRGSFPTLQAAKEEFAAHPNDSGTIAVFRDGRLVEASDWLGDCWRDNL